MHWNVQKPNITKKLCEREISPLVVDNSYDNEEKNECAEKKIQKNTAQRWAQGKQEKLVCWGEKKVPSSNKERKNEILETTLHHNYTK